MNCMYRTLLAAVALAVSSVTASAETITVCADGCDYTSINAAIGAASPGDVIQLAAETYFEGEVIDMQDTLVHIRGVIGEKGEPLSVIDGGGAHRIIECVYGLSSTFTNLVIQNGRSISKFGSGAGLWIDAGSSPRLTNCIFRNNVANKNGGAVFNDGGAIEVVDCRFEFNQAIEGRGGGVFTYGEVTPTFDGCVFDGNSATRGGGIHIGEGTPFLDKCVFLANVAEIGGGISNESFERSPLLNECVFEGNFADYGGGMHNWHSYPDLVDCKFCENSSRFGGGINNENESRSSLRRCEFSRNSAEFGGGMFNNFSSPELIACDFVDNTAAYDGGGLGNEGGSSPTLNECSFLGNSAGKGGGVFNFNKSNPAIFGCVFASNSASRGGGGGIESETSIAILSGSTVCGNSPSQIFGDWNDNTGNCVQSWCDDCDPFPVPCPGDLDQNDEVDASDLGLLIAAWNTDGSIVEGSDINGDGTVSAADLGLLIGAWGPCQ